MDDSLLVRMLHGVADLNKQLQPFLHAQPVLVTVLGDLDTIDQFHHEVRPARVGGAGIEDSGDIRMIHQGQGLALGLEPCDHIPCIHTQLDNLKGDAAANRLFLLGHIDDAATAFPKLLE